MSVLERATEMLEIISDGFREILERRKQDTLTDSLWMWDAHVKEIILQYRDILYALSIRGKNGKIIIRQKNITRRGAGVERFGEYSTVEGETGESISGDGTILIALVVLYLNREFTDISHWEGGYSDFWRRAYLICCGRNHCGCAEIAAGVGQTPNSRRVDLLEKIEKKWRQEETYTEEELQSKIKELSSKLARAKDLYQEGRRLVTAMDLAGAGKIRDEYNKELKSIQCPVHMVGCISPKYNEACFPSKEVAHDLGSMRINNELYLEWSREYLESKGLGGLLLLGCPPGTESADGKKQGVESLAAPDSAAGGGYRKKKRSSKRKKSSKRRNKFKKSNKRKIPKRNNKKRSYNKRRKMRGGSNQIEIMSDFKKEQEELRLLARDNDKAEFKGKFNEMIKMVNFDSSSSKGTESFLFNFIEQYTGIDTRRLKYKKGFTDDWLSSRFEISTLFLEYDGGDYAGDKHIIKLQICPSIYRYLFIEEWYKSIRAWYAGLSPKPIFILLLSNEKDGKDYIFMSFQKMITWDEIIHMFPGKGIGRYPLWQEEEWAKIYDFPEGEQKPNSEVEHALKGLNERLKKIEGDDPELKHIDLHNENIVFETESGFIYAYIIDWGPGWGWGRPPVSSDVR